MRQARIKLQNILLRLQRLKRPKPPEMVDIFLVSDVITRAVMPLSVAREHWGVNGYRVRLLPNWRLIFGLAGGLLFALQIGIISFTQNGDMSQLPIPVGMGFAIGVLLGNIMGAMTLDMQRKMSPTRVYAAWQEWDEKTQTNNFTPIEHQVTSLSMTPEEVNAYLVSIGEEPARPRPIYGIDGSIQQRQPELTRHIVPSYTSKGLYDAVQAKTVRRILTQKNDGERIAQYASMGGIAVSLMAIAALVGIVVTDDGGTTTTVTTPASQQVQRK